MHCAAGACLSSSTGSSLVAANSRALPRVADSKLARMVVALTSAPASELDLAPAPARSRAASARLMRKPSSPPSVPPPCPTGPKGRVRLQLLWHVAWAAPSVRVGPRGESVARCLIRHACQTRQAAAPVAAHQLRQPAWRRANYMSESEGTCLTRSLLPGLLDQQNIDQLTCRMQTVSKVWPFIQLLLSMA